MAAVLVVSNGSAQQPGGRTIALVEHEGASKETDVAPRGRPSMGDSVVFRNLLFNSANARVGTTHGACVLTRASRRRAVAQCNATLVLRDGQIAVLGAVVLKENFVVPVVGGNGAYAGARGTVTFRNRPTGGLTNVTVRLLP